MLQLQISAGARGELGIAVQKDSQPVSSLRHENAVVLDRVTTSLPCGVRSLEGHQPGGM